MTEREQALEAALRDAREVILRHVHARGSEAEVSDDDHVGFINAALAMPPAQGVEFPRRWEAAIEAAANACRRVGWPKAYERHPENYGREALARHLAAEECANAILALLPPSPAPWTPPSQTGVWPDFIAPSRYENPHPDWTDPALPDFRLIWKVARECGYAVGLHGSMKRDCDLIAAPWADDAVASLKLIERLCSALGGKTVGPIAGKPHGRLGFILQSERWEKNIDISVMPLTPPAPEARDE